MPAVTTTASTAEPADYAGMLDAHNQVRRSVRSVRGNQWMFRTGHIVDHPLRIRPELLQPPLQGVAVEPPNRVRKEVVPVAEDVDLAAFPAQVHDLATTRSLSHVVSAMRSRDTRTP